MCETAFAGFGCPMTTSQIPAPSTTRARTWVFACVVGIALLTYATPFYGVMLSMTLPLVTHLGRRHLWPSASRPTSLVCSLLAWVGLWLPTILDFSTALFFNAGVEV